MPAPTWGWTERHSAVAWVLVLALGGALVGLVEDSPIPLWVATALAVASVVALALDAWAGALVGLFAAVTVVGARRWSGLWSSDVLLPALLETLVVVLVGAAAGHAGGVLRGGGYAAAVYDPFEPVHGSLGLLGQDAAMARLEEDVARGERLLRPVTLAMFDVVAKDESLPPAGRAAAERAVARAVESRAGEHDVPFALASGRMGIVFPDSPLASVWDVVGRILESVADASFAFGADRSARPLAQAVDVLVGISRQSAERSTAGALLDDAVSALDRARREELAP